MKKVEENNKKQSNKIESFLTILSIFIVIITYFITYKVSYNDPIATVKSLFIKAELIAIAITIIIAGLTIVLVKNKNKLMKLLKLISILSVITIAVFLCVKIHLDKKYNNRNVFDRFYQEYEMEEDEEEYELGKNEAGFRLPEISIMSPRELYIKESISGYTHFSIKVGIYMVAELIITIAIACVYFKLVMQEERKKEFKNHYRVLYNKK